MDDRSPTLSPVPTTDAVEPADAIADFGTIPAPIAGALGSRAASASALVHGVSGFHRVAAGTY
jgi:hypothetical protein